MEAIIVGILAIALIFGLVIYSSISWGFVLMKFWVWFVLPVFPLLPVLTFWQAVGLMFIFGLFGKSQISPKEKDNTSVWTTLLLGPWLTLFGGWLIGTLFIW